MLYWYLLFFFVTVGAKLLLAVAMIYLLLPSDRRCNQCDGETLLLRPTRLGRVGSRLTFGWVQWRWCPQCGWEGLARRGPEPSAPAGTRVGPSAPTRH